MLRLGSAVLAAPWPVARLLARSAIGNVRDHPSVELSLTSCLRYSSCVRSAAVRAVRDTTDFRLGSLLAAVPTRRWHQQIGDPTLADGILDRLVHDAHRIEMRGDSMRKNRGRPMHSCHQ